AWASDNALVYSVSPIYGTPGIFMFDCASKETRRLVGPVTVDKAYPQGADYFELKKLSPEKKLVYFYYAPDVDAVDFTQFRTDRNLFQVSIDGTEFQKAK